MRRGLTRLLIAGRGSVAQRLPFARRGRRRRDGNVVERAAGWWGFSALAVSPSQALAQLGPERLGPTP